MGGKKVAIIGLGAVGGLISYILYRAGYSIIGFHRRREVIEKILAQGGLKVKVNGEIKNIPIEPRVSNDHSEEFEIIFLTVKAYDTRSTLPLISKILHPNGIIVVVQNGIGGLEVVGEHVGYDRVCQLVLNCGVTLVKPGVIEIKGCNTSYLGFKGDHWSKKIIEVYNTLKGGGLNVELVSDIEPYRWLKLIVNAAINGLTSIYNVKNGVLIEVDEFKELVKEVVGEGAKVAKALGVKLPKDPLEETLRVAKATRHNLSSTLQDLLRGGKTEVEYINGVIVSLGERLGVETPYNNFILKSILGLEKWRGKKSQL